MTLIRNKLLAQFNLSCADLDELFAAKAEEIFPDVMAGANWKLSTGARGQVHFRCDVDWMEHADTDADAMAIIINRLCVLDMDQPGSAGSVQAAQILLRSIRENACKRLAMHIAPFLVYNEMMEAKEP